MIGNWTFFRFCAFFLEIRKSKPGIIHVFLVEELDSPNGSITFFVVLLKWKKINSRILQYCTVAKYFKIAQILVERYASAPYICITYYQAHREKPKLGVKMKPSPSRQACFGILCFGFIKLPRSSINRAVPIPLLSCKEYVPSIFDYSLLMRSSPTSAGSEVDLVNLS